jgi:hypothetical protein
VGQDHVLAATFRAEVIGGTLSTASDPVGVSVEARWASVDASRELM